MGKFLRLGTDILTIITVILWLFVLWYPDLLNDSGKCDWSDEPLTDITYSFKDYLPERINNMLASKFPFLTEKTILADPEKSIHLLAFGDPQINGNWPSTKYIKRLDNLGNDYYLGHIYNTMKSRLHPSHVAVMGDQFLSQWIHDSEFYNRSKRFVERLFPRLDEQKQTIIDIHAKHENYDWQSWMKNETNMDPESRFNSRVYTDKYDWTNDDTVPNFDEPLFINLTGNHDIGYSGDATWQHMARFHLIFGQNNYVINYNVGQANEWRLVVIDSLTLEGPALEPDFLTYTWEFINYLQEKQNPDFKGSTVLLTHIPFYKKPGICFDSPEHVYYENYEKEPYKNGKLRSQNQISEEVTQKVLKIVFPNPDQNGIILTGHDHVGCDSWYNHIDEKWVASKAYKKTDKFPIREVVVTSMMGDFDGQTGLLTGQFKNSKWMFTFSYCSFTVQHWWWAAFVSIFLTIFLQSACMVY